MRALVRIAMVTLVGCGALLTATAAPAAAAPRDDSLLTRLVGADLGTVIKALPGVLCGNRLISYNSPSPNSPTTCINGPKNSGNSTNSGNYRSEGNPINSGNFSNANGSNDSNNVGSGANIANGSQSGSAAGG